MVYPDLLFEKELISIPLLQLKLFFLILEDRFLVLLFLFPGFLIDPFSILLYGSLEGLDFVFIRLSSFYVFVVKLHPFRRLKFFISLLFLFFFFDKLGY